MPLALLISPRWGLLGSSELSRFIVERLWRFSELSRFRVEQLWPFSQSSHGEVYLAPAQIALLSFRVFARPISIFQISTEGEMTKKLKEGDAQ